MSCDRCTGHCCRAFTLPHPHATLKEMADHFDDGRYIADMLIPLYEGIAKDMPAEVLTKIDLMARSDAERQPNASFYVFTCRHFDGESCTAYESRPHFCRNYPDDRKCAYAGCTWKAAREGRTLNGVEQTLSPTPLHVHEEATGQHPLDERP